MTEGPVGRVPTHIPQVSTLPSASQRTPDQQPHRRDPTTSGRQLFSAKTLGDLSRCVRGGTSCWIVRAAAVCEGEQNSVAMARSSGSGGPIACTLEGVQSTEAREQPVVPLLCDVLAVRGITLAAGARVLDFGCGLGRHVREFRAAGYKASGIDLELPAIVQGRGLLPDRGCDLYFSARDGTFPFESESFDFCFSTSTLEHVMSYQKPLAEIARVLKPGALSLHFYPSGWRPLEPHSNIPFGGKIHPMALLRVWVKLGLARERETMTTRQLAEWYARYFVTDVNYISVCQMEKLCEPYFSNLWWVEKEWVRASLSQSRASSAIRPYIDLPGVSALYRGVHTRALLLQR